MESWKGSDRWTTADTARKAEKIATDNGTTRFYYDAVGVGSGIRGPLRDTEPEFVARGCQFGGAVEEPDDLFIAGRDPKTQGEYFRNWFAQASWALRLRAENTMRLAGGEDIDTEKCLFINPKISDLEYRLAEMAQPEWDESSGKVRIDKQPRQAGEAEPKSPDNFDAAVLAGTYDLRRSLRYLMVPARSDKAAA